MRPMRPMRLRRAPRPDRPRLLHEVALIVETLEDIGVTRLSRGIFNCYLIHNAGGDPVVVDPGLPGLAGDLLPLMEEFGLGGVTTVAACATHAHSDHVGGVPALVDRIDAKVHLPERVRSFLEGAKPRTPRVRDIARIWPTSFDQPFDGHGLLDAVRGARVAGYGGPAGMRWPDALEAAFLADGDHLPGAPEWDVLATPGHTDDSMAFWHAGTRTLLSGDAVLSVGGRAWITPETVDDAASARTAERLRSLDVAHLLPGHGRPVHGDEVTARALGPLQGPRGFGSFARGLLGCLRGGRGQSAD